MKKYFYFRDATNEDADLTAKISATIPVKDITAIAPHSSNTTLNVWFKSLRNGPVNDYATLTVTEGKFREVTAELVAAMNGGPHSDGFVVVADTVVTTDGSTSIQGDDKTVSSKFLSDDITGVALVTT